MDNRRRGVVFAYSGRVLQKTRVAGAGSERMRSVGLRFVGAAMASLLIVTSVSAGAAPARNVRAELDAAIAAAGGTKALTNARVLAWKGHAVVHAGERTIELEGEWTVEPPDRARVTTWERSKGRESARGLSIDGDRGDIVRGGKTEPMTSAMRDHEREQFRLYDAMRLVPLLRDGVTLTAVDAPPGEHALRATGFMTAPVDLYFDTTNRLVGLRATVIDPQSGATIDEQLRFSGEVRSADVVWPKRIAITWAGAPYFDLDIVELAITPNRM